MQNMWEVSGIQIMALRKQS